MSKADSITRWARKHGLLLKSAPRKRYDCRSHHDHPLRPTPAPPPPTPMNRKWLKFNNIGKEFCLYSLTSDLLDIQHIMNDARTHGALKKRFPYKNRSVKCTQPKGTKDDLCFKRVPRDHRRSEKDFYSTLQPQSSLETLVPFPPPPRFRARAPAFRAAARFRFSAMYA